MTTMSERFAAATNALYPRVIHDGGTALHARAATGALADLAAHKYCAVVTYRRNGTPVSTPVWFGLAPGRLYFRSLANTAKLRRIAANSNVLVAPCTAIGRPTGPPLAGYARMVSGAEADEAERRIQRHYGLFRRAYEWAIGGADATYVEVTPRTARDGG